MNFPEKPKINITQLWRRPPADLSPDPTDSCPREREPLLSNLFSSHFCKVGAKCQNPSKIQDQYFLEQGPQRSDTFLDTCKTTKPRDIRIQVRRTLLYRVPRNNAMFHDKIKPPMERFHFFSRPNPKIWVAAFLIHPQDTRIVCRQDMCCVCRQDIC